MNKPTDTAQPRRRTGLWAALIIVVALGAAGGAYWYNLRLGEQRLAQEQQAFEALASSCSSADFQAFLDSFPESDFRAQVKERRNLFRQMETRWSQIVTSGRTDDFVDFKNRFSNPYYDRLCNLKIDSLDWLKAQRHSTPEAVEAYIAQHPDGLYYPEATIVLATLQQAVRDSIAQSRRDTLQTSDTER